MVIHCGRGSFRAVDVVVADMVCGRHGCGRYGLWPIWYRPNLRTGFAIGMGEQYYLGTA